MKPQCLILMFYPQRVYSASSSCAILMHTVLPKSFSFLTMQHFLSQMPTLAILYFAVISHFCLLLEKTCTPPLYHYLPLQDLFFSCASYLCFSSCCSKSPQFRKVVRFYFYLFCYRSIIGSYLSPEIFSLASYPK